MFSLFPELRPQNTNTYSSIVAHRITRLSRVLRATDEPLTPTRIQAGLIATGETWAEGHAGYMAVWSLVNQMLQAGLVVGGGKEGVRLQTGAEAITIYAAALSALVLETIPTEDGLGAFRREVVRAIQAATMTARHQHHEAGVHSA